MDPLVRPGGELPFPCRPAAVSAPEPVPPLEVTLAGVAFALLAPGGTSSEAEAAWLNTHLASVSSLRLSAGQLVARWSRSPPAADRGLQAIAANLRLSPMETVALVLCRAVETDP